MEKKESVAKIDNLENQIQELTHLVTRLLKNQNPTPSTQAPYTSSLAKEKPSISSEPIPEASNAYPKPLDPSIFFTKARQESKGYSRKTEKKRHAFAPLPNDLFTMCARLVKDKLIARMIPSRGHASQKEIYMFIATITWMYPGIKLKIAGN